MNPLNGKGENETEGIENGIRLVGEDRVLLKTFMGKEMPIVLTWNSLMPVVEKITTLRVELKRPFQWTKKDRTLYERIEAVEEITITSGINYVYQIVVEFIKWHSQLDSKPKERSTTPPKIVR
jgi:hypothetical protein